MLELLFSNPFAFVLVFGGIILAIGLHEAAHCFMADHLGDPTPRSLGRLTLNPLAHLDPMGTLVILVTGFFGWGKASPFDPYNLKDPKRDTALIALAGPAVNLALAIICSLLLRLSLPIVFTDVLFTFIHLNVGLAIFNLLPVPPLDGSKIIGLFMSHETGYKYQRLSGQNSYLLILILILPLFGGHSLASLVTSPIINFILSLLIPVV